MATPLGDAFVVTDAQGVLRALDFADHTARLRRKLQEHHGAVEVTEEAVPSAIARAVSRYFAGDLAAVEELPVHPGGTASQLDVWAALRRIPAGSTTSYGKLARALGYTDPRAAIDVGAAVGANPIAIVIPCHRVIAGNGELKGYAWGVHRKRWLLQHENALQSQSADAGTATLPGF
jgi:methylated-DNA-[protein]-cysteine S-methyltransferase